MSYALVGSAGAVSTGTSGASVTPAWGTGESRTAGNLLILVVAAFGSGTLPSAPAGWSIAKQQANSTSDSASIFYKIAAGGDAAPTVAAVTSTILSARLYEFSGNAGSFPLDQTGSVSSTSALGDAVYASSGTDATLGELIITANAVKPSVAGTESLGDFVQSGGVGHNVSMTETDNNATSTTSHYCFGYGVTATGSGADSNEVFWNGTSPLASVMASFKLPAPGALSPPAFVNENGDNDTTGYDLDASVALNGTSQYISIPNDDTSIGTATVTIASPAVITKTAHGLSAGDQVYLTTTGALPTGLTASTNYYVLSTGLTANSFEVSSTYEGTAINTSGTQSGTHTLHKVLWITDPAHAWTVEAWIYPTAVRSSAGECAIVTRQYSTSDIPFVLGYGFSSPADAQGAFGGVDSAGTTRTAAPTGAQVWVGFFNVGDGWYQLCDPTPLATADLNTWIHYVGTWDGTGLTLYRNGIRVAPASGTPTGIPGPGFSTASSSGLATYIGRRWDTSGATPYFPGRIDEVAVYNKALSHTQVTSHYAAQKVRINATWTDISADVVSVQTQRGRTYELDAYQSGTATVVLDDAERKYDAANNNSVYNGGDSAHPWYRILPLRPIRIRAAANDLSNPDFEEALSGTDWSSLFSATLSLDTSNYYTGSQSLQVVTSATLGSGVQSERVPMTWQRLEANAIVSYQVNEVRTSAWVYADSGADVQFYIEELDSGGGVLTTGGLATVTGGSATWTFIEENYTLTNASTTQVRVVFVNAATATATFHVDAVKVAPVWPIFQGYVDAWPETWEPPDYATTTLTAADGFEPLTQAQIETTVLSPVPVGTAYTQIPKLLNLAYWPGPSSNTTGMRYITYSNSTDITKQMASIDGSQGSDYALTVLQDVTNSELGSFFMGKNGAAVFQDGLYRTNFITVMGQQGQFSDDNAELDAGTMLEYADMTTSYDQQKIINDWTVSPDPSASPATVGRSINADSIRRYLRRSNSRSTRLNNASDAQTQADSLITRTGTDVWNGGRVTPSAVLRVETLAIEPLNNRLLWRQALQREISDLIYVERLPGGQGPGAGGSGLRGTFFIEQITWQMDVNSPWRVSWQLSPSSFSTGAHPFQLDVTPYDRLDGTHPLL